MHCGTALVPLGEFNGVLNVIRRRVQARGRVGCSRFILGRFASWVKCGNLLALTALTGEINTAYLPWRCYAWSVDMLCRPEN